MVPSLKVARRRGGSARVDSHLGRAAQFAVRPRLVAGYIAGLGSADRGQFGSGDRARPAAKNYYDHRPASAHILTHRAAKRSPHRRRVSLPRLQRPRPFHAFGVGRHRTMNVWGRCSSRTCRRLLAGADGRLFSTHESWGRHPVIQTSPEAVGLASVRRSPARSGAGATPPHPRRCVPLPSSEPGHPRCLRRGLALARHRPTPSGAFLFPAPSQGTRAAR